MRHHQSQLHDGFAMLFTVLIVSLILTIAIGISDLTLKQTILSNLAKDSGVAFYQADSAVECGMYEDTTLAAFPLNATVNTGASTDVPQTFSCGGTTMQLTQVGANYFQYTPVGVKNNEQCFSITFDKTDPTGVYRVDGQGFSRCGPSPRQVERTLEVKY